MTSCKAKRISIVTYELLKKFHDAKLDVSANQYSGKVDFVQLVKVKGAAKTNVTGKLEFQTCDDEKCLPPKTLPFSIALK